MISLLGYSPLLKALHVLPAFVSSSAYLLTFMLWFNCLAAVSNTFPAFMSLAECLPRLTSLTEIFCLAVCVPASGCLNFVREWLGFLL
jgi:hypothetical protein